MLIDITDTVQLTHTAAEVDADIDGSVRGDIAQIKDDTWKAQARDNIGAGTGSGGGGGRNLLDNGWFIIDQRNASGAIPNGGYVADRWTITGNGGSRDGNIVRLDGTGAYTYVRQNVENELKAIIAGKTVTLSFMLEDGQVYSHTFNSIANGVQNTYSMAVLGTGYLDIDMRATPNIKILANGVNIGIKAIWLEVGPVSSLADELPPDYVTELMKCKRYFQRSEEAFVGYCDSATRAIAIFNYPVEMRANPTMSVAGSYYVTKSGSGMTTTSITAQSVKTKYAMANFFVSSGLTVGQCVLLSPNAPGYIDFSADL